MGLMDKESKPATGHPVTEHRGMRDLRDQRREGNPRTPPGEGGGPARPIQASYRLLDELLRRGEAEAIGRQLGITFQTVRNWCHPRARLEPTGTGRYNPLDALQTLVETWAERDGTLDRGQRLAQWVAQLCGGVFVPAPPGPPGDLHSGGGQLCTVLGTVSELLAALHASGVLQGVSPVPRRDLERIETAGRGCAGAILRLVRWLGPHGGPRTPSGDREGGGSDAH